MKSGAAEFLHLGPALLFCPADRPDRYAKALQRSDAVIFDLEDAVSAADTPAAREHLGSHLQQASPEDLRRTVVRVNAAGSTAFGEDAQALAHLHASGVHIPYVMVPKVESAADLDQVALAFPGAALVALIETARGVTAAAEIAAHPDTVGVMWGAEDLIASLGGTSSRTEGGQYRAVVQQARSMVLLHAAAAGAVPIDAIYAAISDHEGLAAEASDAAASGFPAKACIHPGHVSIIRDAFAPTQEQVAEAQELLAHTAGQPGAFTFRGAMIDEPLLRHAEHTLRRAGLQVPPR